MSRTALITGVNGQDGSYLSELLIEKGYHVHGMVRRTSQFNRGRIEEVRTHAETKGLTFELHYGNMGDSTSLNRVISRCKPDEIYNLAAQSHVAVSFDEPEHTTEVNATGVLRLLEITHHNFPDCRIYQACSSDLYGDVTDGPISEQTPFRPLSPYAISKLYAYWTVHNFREAHGMHASNGIMFNHESPRRGENFVTRKITYSLARIRAGLQETLSLGNLDSQRDWGFARDYVEAMWLMLQQDRPDDYVIASGETHSVREFVERAAMIAGFDLAWDGEGTETRGIDRNSSRTVVDIDARFYRPIDSNIGPGDASKAQAQLGWKPRASFQELVELMMQADLDSIS